MTRWLWFLIFAASAVAAVSASAATLRSKDGKTYTGQVNIIEGQFSIATSDGQMVTIAPADVAALDMRTPATGPATTTAPATVPTEARAASAMGTGLRAEYFSDITFHTLKLIRGDPDIYFDFTPPRQPIAMGDTTAWHPMSVRWTGKIRPQFSERYSLFVPAESLFRIWVNHHLIVDNGQNEVMVNFEAGKMYELRVEWCERQRAPSAVIEWSSKSLPRQPISSECLFPPDHSEPMPPTVRMTAPPPGIVLAGPLDVPLSTVVQPGTSTPVKVSFSDRDALIGVSKSAPFDFLWQDAPIGDHAIVATVTNADGTIGTSAPLHVVIAAEVGQSMPKSWVTCDVPQSGLDPAMSARRRHGRAPAPLPTPSAAQGSPPPTFQNDTLTLQAAGGDVYAQDDTFHYVFQRLVGDGSIVARVADVSADPKGSRPLAGVMIRSALTGNSPYAAMLVVPTVGHVFLCRHNASEQATNTSSPGDAPIYFKLTRKGFAVRVYRSSDGRKWEFMGETEMAMPASMLVGVMVCGGDSGVNATAHFDHLSVTVDTGISTQPFQPTVVLTDGTRLIGTITKTSKGVATITTPAGEAGIVPTLPESAIARLQYRPLSADALGALSNTQTGVFLETGDFFEGDIQAFTADHLTVDSVVFGPRDFATANISAIILHPIAKPAAVEANLTDGSSIHSTSLSLSTSGIQLQSAAGAITIPLKDIQQLIRH